MLVKYFQESEQDEKESGKRSFGFAKTYINRAAKRHTNFIIYSFLFIIL